MDCSPPGSSVHRTCQARVLEIIIFQPVPCSTIIFFSSFQRDLFQIYAFVAHQLQLYLCRYFWVFVGVGTLDPRAQFFEVHAGHFKQML